MVKLTPLLRNRNWAMARTPKFENPLLPGLTELKPNREPYRLGFFKLG
jgi:hypothetical protein